MYRKPAELTDEEVEVCYTKAFTDAFNASRAAGDIPQAAQLKGEDAGMRAIATAATRKALERAHSHACAGLRADIAEAIRKEIPDA